VIEVIRPGQTDFYAITQIQIVDPENVSVLAPTSTQTLTLVTCYPFYFIGNAPQRYIVTASYQISDRVDVSVSSESFSTGKKNNKKEKQDESK
jgi:LPXTG-site transpeptidase (sortase) family protein